MPDRMTIEEMKRLITRQEQARKDDVDIPQGYIDRLERAGELLREYRELPKINWDSLATNEDIEHAEAVANRKKEIKFDIERHFSACALTGPAHGAKGAAKKEKGARQRRPRRDKDQIEQARKVAQITQEVKRDLGLPTRGRIAAEDRERFEETLAKELKRQHITAPNA